MSGPRIDLSHWLGWQDGLPVPRWEEVQARIDAMRPEARAEAWTSVARQWLHEIGRALGGGYETTESRHFLILAPEADGVGRRFLQGAEHSRAAVRSVLGELADFDAFGRPVVIVLRDRRHYYTYVSLYYPEGEHDCGPRGIHIREGHPHVAVHGRDPLYLQTLAHLLTRVALHHLSMPQWLQEGLAQMVAHDDWNRPESASSEDMMADRHRRYWRRYGLGAFWSGEAFSRRGGAQKLSHPLARILVRLLFDDAPPSWFGRAREPRKRLFAFLRAAEESDGGEAACREHLGFGLGDLAGRFLGPGEWAPAPPPIKPPPSS
jgi:hypothetical protein